jgi:transcription termination/antitermination protein NusG
MDALDLDLEGPGTWFVLHTKSRQEKAMAGDLAARKVAHFLPLVTKIRTSGSRKIKVQEPLFPGYLFLRGSQDDVYNADRTTRVAHIITVPNQQRLIWELRNLAMALQNKTPLDPYPYLKEGVRVEVTSGPLRGLQGIIETRSSIDRLILSVEILGRAVSVELHGALLDVV